MASVLVTWMSLTVAAGRAGATTVNSVSSTTDTPVPGTPANVTVAPSRKWVPVRVTTSPPADDPERGSEA